MSGCCRDSQAVCDRKKGLSRGILIGIAMVACFALIFLLTKT